MQNLMQRLAETTAFIKSKIRVAPYIGYLTGTGLGKSAESMTLDTTVELLVKAGAFDVMRPPDAEVGDLLH